MPCEAHNLYVHVEQGGTWGSPEGWTSDRCAGCGGVLTLTRLWRQPEPEDHAAGCRQLSLALQAMLLAAEIAQATPEQDEGTSPAYDLSWRRYVQEATHDLKGAARAKSVSDALKQQGHKYAADSRADDTDEGRGRAAAAKMLRLACQSLTESRNRDYVASNASMKQFILSTRTWFRRLPRGRRGSVR
jgi:hypothetical protein